MRVTAALVLTLGLATSAGAQVTDGQALGALPGGSTVLPAPVEAVPAPVAPLSAVPAAPLPSAAAGAATPGSTLPGSTPPGRRIGAGSAAASLGAERPAVEPNPRLQELDRKSREIDRRVMRSICSGC